MEFKNLPCNSCRYIIPVESKYCQFCGLENLHRKGVIGKTFCWLKDVSGLSKKNPKNLFDLEKMLESKITRGVNKVSLLRNQLKAIFKTIGLEERLNAFRAGFMKFGGGSIKALMEDSGQKKKLGAEYFKKMTDPEILVDSRNFEESIEELFQMVMNLKWGLDKCKDYKIFVPRSEYEKLLKDTYICLDKIRNQSTDLSKTSQSLRTISHAISLYNKKLAEYAIILHGVKVELWIAEANKSFYEIFFTKMSRQNISSKLDTLTGAGRRFVFQLKEDLNGNSSLGITNLIEKIEAQLVKLEEGKIACATNQAVGAMEKLRLFDDSLLSNDLCDLETKTISPAILLHETFEKAKDEEIRLLSEKKASQSTL